MKEKSDNHIYKEHNKTLLLYHLVFPIKYRKKVLTKSVENTLRNTCFEIQERREIYFLEIGNDEDHVHFLIQSVPTMCVTKIVQIIKTFTSKIIREKHPEVKKILWGGALWTSGYYANTVGEYSNKDAISKYIQNQGKNYKKIYHKQPTLF